MNPSASKQIVALKYWSIVATVVVYAQLCENFNSLGAVGFNENFKALEQGKRFNTNILKVFGAHL